MKSSKMSKGRNASKKVGNHWVRSSVRFLNDVNDTVCVQDRVVRWPVFHRRCRYFTANLADAGERPVFLKSVSEAGIVKIDNLP